MSEARILRVIVCPACSWQYGAMWSAQGVYEYWGDCPKCGHSTEVQARFLRESGGVAAVAGPKQMELAL